MADVHLSPLYWPPIQNTPSVLLKFVPMSVPKLNPCKMGEDSRATPEPNVNFKSMSG